MEISRTERFTGRKPYSLSRTAGIFSVLTYLHDQISVEDFLINRVVLELDPSDVFHRPASE